MAAWMFIVMVFPFAGFALYWLIGIRREARERLTETNSASHVEKRMNVIRALCERNGSSKVQPSEAQAKLYQLLSSASPYPAALRNKCKVLKDGNETFEAMLSAMRQARHHIHLDYYTIRNDGVGERFLQILMVKAREGVEVRVLYDGVGSWKLSSDYVNRLRTAGADVFCFAPLALPHLTKRLNFRNHRKIAVIDGVTGFLGGINIGDEYIGLDQKLGYWRDTHLQIQGDAVYSLQDLFLRDWFAASGELLSDDSRYIPVHSIEAWQPMFIVPGRPGLRGRGVSEALSGIIHSAQHYVYAATPYFIPDPAMAAALMLAARSGIDVRLIVPNVSDSRLVMLATLSHVKDMLKAGVRVFRYQKGFIHSKVLTADECVAAVGTANLDMRSMYSNYEAMAVILDQSVVQRLKSDFLNDLKESEEISEESLENRSKGSMAVEAALRIISPLL